jgi:hypothetical protein
MHWLHRRKTGREREGNCVSCILKRSLECLTKNYLAKKKEGRKGKNLKLNVQSVWAEFMHRLHNSQFLSLSLFLLFLYIQKGKSYWMCFVLAFLYDDREQLFILLVLCDLLLLLRFFLEMRNMCNNTLLPVLDCCSSGMQKSEVFFMEKQDTKGGISCKNFLVPDYCRVLRHSATVMS